MPESKRLAALIPVLILVVNLLTLLNLPVYDEALEEPAAGAFHLRDDQPRFNPLTLTVAPFEGLGQALVAVWLAGWACLTDSYLAVKLGAIACQIGVWLAWWAWARRWCSFRVLLISSVFFVLPPDNYFGAMIMSYGHHAESLLVIFAALIVVDRHRKTGGSRAVAGLGVLAGFGVTCYPINLLLGVFLALGTAGWWFPRLSRARRLAFFAAGAVVGYLPLMLLFLTQGQSPMAQLLSRDVRQTPVHTGTMAVDRDPVLVQVRTEMWRTLTRPGRLSAKAIHTARGIWVSTADRYTYLPAPVDQGYAALGCGVILLAVGFWLRRIRRPDGPPAYVLGYAAVIITVYLFAGNRFTVAYDRPGEPGAYRYLLPLYPFLFMALAGLVQTALARGARAGRAWFPTAAVLGAVLLFAGYPVLTRCRHDPERFGQVAALRLGYPATLGNAYYLEYGPEGLAAALRQAARLAPERPGTGELVARGLAVAAAVGNGFQWPRLAGYTPPEDETEVRRGWWQGLGFCFGGLREAGLAVPDQAPVAFPDPECGDWFWSGVGHYYGYDGELTAAALRREPSVPLASRDWYWAGYGEGMTAAIYRANADLYRSPARLARLPFTARAAAASGFRRGVERLVWPDAIWSRSYYRWLDRILAGGSGDQSMKRGSEGEDADRDEPGGSG